MKDPIEFIPASKFRALSLLDAFQKLDQLEENKEKLPIWYHEVGYPAPTWEDIAYSTGITDNSVVPWQFVYNMMCDIVNHLWFEDEPRGFWIKRIGEEEYLLGLFEGALALRLLQLAGFFS